MSDEPQAPPPNAFYTACMHFIGGTLGGMTGVATSYPLDTIKVSTFIKKKKNEKKKDRKKLYIYIRISLSIELFFSFLYIIFIFIYNLLT